MNKYIEEMAKIIAQSVDEETICDGMAGDSSMTCFCCEYSEKEYCKHHIESATGLYNKGYRKASEGEWVDQYKGKYANALYKCSICNNAAHINELTSKWILTPFCPSCGAKMKGKNDEQAD